MTKSKDYPATSRPTSRKPNGANYVHLDEGMRHPVQNVKVTKGKPPRCGVCMGHIRIK